jgi:hypothetical protein
VIATLVVAAVLAAPPARAEVDALLSRLEQSGCRFQRNGEWHEARKAREHLAGKLAYLERRGTLESAEQFIDKVASASSVSGEPYRVQCGTAPAVKSAEWLKGQLKALRAQ